MSVEFRRFLTRAGETLSRERGSIDQMCAQRPMLQDHPHLHSWFVRAMREAVASACVQHPEWGRALWQQGYSPAQMTDWEQLSALLALELPVPESRRGLRRERQVTENCLADLGWARLRRRSVQPQQCAVLVWLGAVPLARCRYHHYHLPRLAALHNGSLFSPLQLHQPLPASYIPVEACDCGRRQPLQLPAELTNLLQK